MQSTLARANVGPGERLLVAMDRARGWVLGKLARSRFTAPIATRRDARMLARVTFGIAFAFIATLVAPGLLFVIGPVVLGVAHVASDVRYLVRRPGVPTGVAALMYGGCASILALRAAELAWPSRLPYAQVELSLATAWIVATAASTGAAKRSALVLGITVAALAFSWNRADVARLVFAHLHNLVGIIIWLVLFRRRRGAFTAPLALLAMAVFALALGWTVPLVQRWHTFDVLGVNLYFVSDLLAPRVSDPTAQGIVLSYVFLQSLHYMVWLVWIPDEATRAQGTPSFRMTARGLRRDFTSWGLAAIGIVSLAVVLGAMIDVHRARMAYLSLASFHGYLELAAFAYLTLRVGVARESSGA